MFRFFLYAISPLYWSGAAAAVIGLGSSIYSAKKQEDAIEDAEEAERKAAEEAEAERKRIFNAQSAEAGNLSATVEFGTQDDTPNQTFDDFLAPKQGASASTLTTKNTGLGFGTA